MNPRTRAFVIVAVLVLVTGALLIVTAAAYMARAETHALAMEERGVQTRALAGSALKAVMSRLDDQRQVMLEGGLPQLDQQLVLYETASGTSKGRLGVARLLAADRQGRPVSHESARIDLNHVDATALTATGLVSADLAAAIVSHRDTALGRPYQSPLELLEVPGMEARQLVGEMEELQRDEAASEEESPAAVLGDIVTVFAADPQVQSDGRAKINLNVEWSESLGDAIARRFDRPAAELVKQLMLGGMKFERPGALVEALASISAPPEQWPAALDAFTTTAQTHRFGLLDVNHAPVEALLALPGVTAAQAALIVQVREELTAQERSSIAWLVSREIVEPAQLAALAERITTRCWVWRVKLAVGEVTAAHPDEALENEVRYEAVIECSAGPARIAYLREVTLLPYAMRLASGDGELAQLIAMEDDDDQEKAPAQEPVTVAETAGVDDDAAVEHGDVALGAAAEESSSPEAPKEKNGRRAGRWVAPRS